MKRTISQDASQVAEDLKRSGGLAMVRHVPNPFSVLGLAVGEQDAGVVRRAFLCAVRTYPPHSHPTEFVCVVEAYEMLRDPARRVALECGMAGLATAAKHRRLGALTPQSAAAFLEARHGPICALDQYGQCHPTVTEDSSEGAAAAAAAADVPCILGAANTAGAMAMDDGGPRTVDTSEDLEDDCALFRTAAVTSPMNLEPLCRTTSACSAMSV
mmetsp:Transcript_26744/g.51563  ORF Transcript_26744/g.51563 Transcript_26744/m.51563 type:complete len:214 (+) Transcript_26744:80-721(+)|eukprot:CAMPEP_0172800824 /NCGR_PEP_ID=MMETSP1075-20121228/2816_1 /TAXON_ID=2916 /ORGANISM="Ceratium fusus, Strain PA161109" /LENGTH=213 /DNA_ID=CAMNT_0013638787 /DNA_START=80 /DNA_END=721 /DNA_ORIENTATION=+